MSLVRTKRFATYSSSESGSATLAHVQTVLALLGLAGSVDAAPSQDVADDNAIITSVLRSAGSEYLLGDSPSSLPQVKQWMSLARTFTADDLVALNAQLAARTYLVGHAFTVADVAVFVPIRMGCVDVVGGYAHVARWFDQVQHLVRRGVFEYVQVAVTAAATSAAAASAASTASAAPAAAATAVANAPSGGKQPQPQQQPQQQKPQQQQQQQKQPQQQPQKKDEKKSGAPAAAATDDADKLDPSQLDIRVGHVVKCWNHPDSDKLLCEEIDLGEATVRTIASGIRPHYQAEDLQGRKVCVLANLKDRSLAGFKSQGMVLCAVSADHSAIKLVEPPVGAAAGERITFPGYTGEPASASAVAKKKILEKLGPQVRLPTHLP